MSDIQHDCNVKGHEDDKETIMKNTCCAQTSCYEVQFLQRYSGHFNLLSNAYVEKSLSDGDKLCLDC